MKILTLILNSKSEVALKIIGTSSQHPINLPWATKIIITSIGAKQDLFFQGLKGDATSEKSST